jgi:hypothetical protein
MLQMPPWFVLSGFVLAVVYKNGLSNPTYKCCNCCSVNTQLSTQLSNPTDIKRFLRNRFARIAPSFYLVTVSNNVKTPDHTATVQPPPQHQLVSRRPLPSRLSPSATPGRCQSFP